MGMRCLAGGMLRMVGECRDVAGIGNAAPWQGVSSRCVSWQSMHGERLKPGDHPRMRCCSAMRHGRFWCGTQCSGTGHVRGGVVPRDAGSSFLAGGSGHVRRRVGAMRKRSRVRVLATGFACMQRPLVIAARGGRGACRCGRLHNAMRDVGRQRSAAWQACRESPTG
jgi:hypothetical protein